MVTVHDVVEADGRLFLVMELVGAPTLRELVDRSGPLTPAAAARAGLQLVDALEAAHAAGIVHHDVKPANVMVAPDGRVKLADFGIASLQEDTQRTLSGVAGAAGPGGGDGVAGIRNGEAGTGGPGAPAGGREPTAVFGSLPYVAPEQATGRPAGPAADLWALGATLWFAVEGAAPFERGHPAATLAAILADPPGHPARAGPLGPVLLALLDKDPVRRPTALEVRRMLVPVAAGPQSPTVPMGGAPGAIEPEPWFPGSPTREGSPAGRGGPGAVHSPAGREGGGAVPSPPGREVWGVAGPAPRRARGGRVQLDGWTAPPRRRRGRWVLGAAVVLLLLAVASNLGERSREDPGPAGLGDPVRDGQFEFVVRAVDCGARSVGEGFGRRTALGQFCLVSFRVENTGTEGRTFGGGQQFLFDRDGNRHDPDLAATVGNGGEWSIHLNPGQRLAGTLVYDVPESAVRARVELHDATFSGGARVALD